MAEEQVTASKGSDSNKNKQANGKTKVDPRKPIVDPSVPVINLTELKNLPITDLHPRAEDIGVELDGALRKQDMVFEILRAQTERQGSITGHGILELFPEGYGFLREPTYNYEPSADDIYVAPSQVRSVCVPVTPSSVPFVHQVRKKDTTRCTRCKQSMASTLRTTSTRFLLITSPPLPSRTFPT